MWRDEELVRVAKILKDHGWGRKTKKDNTTLVARRMLELIIMPEGMVDRFAREDYHIIRHWLTIMITVGLKETNGEPFLKEGENE
jgi:hypothetical protein